jgi:solute carrier family 25 citrate transporter 1
MPLWKHFAAGGVAGIVEATTCHPLDTLKVNMQLSASKQRLNPLQAASLVIRRDGPLGFYRGLGAVVLGISPKMAIRFSTFESCKAWLHPYVRSDRGRNFLAGLWAGTVETLLVVNPTEVVKIRMQSNFQGRRNVLRVLRDILRDEGVATLYRGATLTATRQAINQAVNFTLYHDIKARLVALSGSTDGELASWKHFLIGAFSGAMGPLCNAPVDTLKTRIQANKGPKLQILQLAQQILRNEGPLAFWKGITPRIMRIAPGQAVTFAIYERVSKWLGK